MAHFLIQTIEGKVKHDFSFALEHAIEYQKWRGNDMEASYCSIEELEDGVYGNYAANYVPVGSVEFVYAFIDRYIKPDGGSEIRPLNVPEVLMPYARRLISNHTLSDDRQEVYDYWRGNIGPDGRIFVKSNDKLKSAFNDIYGTAALFDKFSLPNGNYQISSLIDIKSEYRCFVYNEELVGIQFYSGDFKVYPDVCEIQKMVRDYCHNSEAKAPQAFTLDVAVTNGGETAVIEVHNFFSCGTYGFDIGNKLPYMFIRAFNEIKTELLRK